MVGELIVPSWMVRLLVSPLQWHALKARPTNAFGWFQTPIMQRWQDPERMAIVQADTVHQRTLAALAIGMAASAARQFRVGCNSSTVPHHKHAAPNQRRSIPKSSSSLRSTKWTMPIMIQASEPLFPALVAPFPRVQLKQQHRQSDRSNYAASLLLPFPGAASRETAEKTPSGSDLRAAVIS